MSAVQIQRGRCVDAPPEGADGQRWRRRLQQRHQGHGGGRRGLQGQML